MKKYCFPGLLNSVFHDNPEYLQTNHVFSNWNFAFLRKSSVYQGKRFSGTNQDNSRVVGGNTPSGGAFLKHNCDVTQRYHVQDALEICMALWSEAIFSTLQKFDPPPTPVALVVGGQPLINRYRGYQIKDGRGWGSRSSIGGSDLDLWPWTDLELGQRGQQSAPHQLGTFGHFLGS